MEANLLFLIIDDDPDDCEFICDAIKKIDPTIQCLIANNGVEAFKILNTLSILPDLIFLDLNMPLMNGHEFISKIKEDNKLNYIPVVISTTSIIHEHLENSLKGKAAYFITKPTISQELIDEIRKVMTAYVRRSF